MLLRYSKLDHFVRTAAGQISGQISGFDLSVGAVTGQIPVIRIFVFARSRVYQGRFAV